MLAFACTHYSGAVLFLSQNLCESLLRIISHALPSPRLKFTVFLLSAVTILGDNTRKTCSMPINLLPVLKRKYSTCRAISGKFELPCFACVCVLCYQYMGIFSFLLYCTYILNFFDSLCYSQFRQLAQIVFTFPLPSVIDNYNRYDTVSGTFAANWRKVK